MSRTDIYNRTQYDLFKKTFGIDPHQFMDAILTSISGKWQFDILKFDDYLAKIDPNYDPENCTYKGRKNFSMNKYLVTKYGQSISNLVSDLNQGKFSNTIYPSEEL